MALTRSDTPNSHTFDQRLLDQIIFWFHNTKPSELVICCPFVLIPSTTALRTATLSLLLPTIPSPNIRYLLCSNFLCHTTPVQITTINMLLSAMNTSVSSSPCSFFPIPHPWSTASQPRRCPYSTKNVIRPLLSQSRLHLLSATLRSSSPHKLHSPRSPIRPCYAFPNPVDPRATLPSFYRHLPT